MQAKNRSNQLKDKISDYIDQRNKIKTGLKIGDKIKEQRNVILNELSADINDWNNWKWQLNNRINTVEKLEYFIRLSNTEKNNIKMVEEKYRWAISPYFLSLIDPINKNCPIRKQALPNGKELAVSDGKTDPMNEELTNPSGSVVRRYPDRLIIKLTNVCAMFCRHCQRRREIGQVDKHTNENIIKESIRYVKENTEIRDVLLTGGDPLTMSNAQLEFIINELRNIEHVEIIRLGTRIPVTMPQRVTNDLCDMLEKYSPIYINLQVNHPKELTKECFEATDKLSKAGIPLGNQAVLLKNINDNSHIMKALNHELLKAKVKPYYIFHAKNVIGTEHFQTSVDAGVEIIENLRGFTSGMAIPKFIVNAPGGLGKTPINPEYVISRGKDYILLRTWEGKVIKYKK